MDLNKEKLVDGKKKLSNFFDYLGTAVKESVSNLSPVQVSGILIIVLGIAFIGVFVNFGDMIDSSSPENKTSVNGVLQTFDGSMMVGVPEQEISIGEVCSEPIQTVETNRNGLFTFYLDEKPDGNVLFCVNDYSTEEKAFDSIYRESLPLHSELRVKVLSVN